jgi:hypothetical protein
LQAAHLAGLARQGFQNRISRMESFETAGALENERCDYTQVYKK